MGPGEKRELTEEEILEDEEYINMMTVDGDNFFFDFEPIDTYDDDEEEKEEEDEEQKLLSKYGF